MSGNYARKVTYSTSGALCEEEKASQSVATAARCVRLKKATQLIHWKATQDTKYKWKLLWTLKPYK